MLPIMFHRVRPLVFSDPFAALNRLSGFFDGESCGSQTSCPPACNVDVREDDHHIYFVAEVPGVARNDLDITLEDGRLTISGEKVNERNEEKDSYQLRERSYGRFSRSFRLGTEVDPARVDASLKDGLLTVTLNKAETARPKRIEVKPG